MGYLNSYHGASLNIGYYIRVSPSFYFTTSYAINTTIQDVHMVKLLFLQPLYVLTGYFSPTQITFSEPIETCGDTLNSTTGSFKTPNLVDPDGMVFKEYGFHEDCLWVLKGQEKSVILLSFLYFILESSQKCKLDFVEVRSFLSL